MALRVVEAPAQPAPSTEATGPPPSIVDYVAELQPDWERFDYFAPYAAEFAKAVGGGLRICFAAPPGHGKTEFTIRGLMWLCRFFPGFRHAYVTYNQTKSKEVAEDFRNIAREAGFSVVGRSERLMVTWAGGRRSIVRFTSVQGVLTGAPIDGVMVVDDYIKGAKEARSAAYRQAGIDWWRSVARTRRHPGTSFIVMATRWPGGDLTEHLTKKEGFGYINLKALAEPENSADVSEDGRVLSDPLGRQIGESLSRRKPPEFFREDRSTPFWWSAMFQGKPRREGLAVFAEQGAIDPDGNTIGPTYYRQLPKEGYRVGFGVDLAYSERSSADWSVLVKGYAAGGKLYIVSVQRKQVQANSFLLTLVAAKADSPGAPFRFYSGGGGEKGVGSFIRKKLGRVFKVLPATTDKLARATPASAAWNLGNVLLPDPEASPWSEEMEAFYATVVAFTGTPGEPDDDVDALAALHDQLLSKNRMLEALEGKQN